MLGDSKYPSRIDAELKWFRLMSLKDELCACSLNYARFWCVILLVALFPLCEVLANSKVTYHGRIIRPDGTPLEGSVEFRIQIRTPGTENCLLYEETQTKPVTNGVFALTLGEGTAQSGSLNLEKVFQNRDGTPLNLSNCVNGPSSYTASSDHGRRLLVSFRDLTNGPVSWEDIPETTVNFVPLAIEAQSVGGFNAKHLLRVVEDGGNETPHEVSALTKTQYDTLLDWLVNGLPGGGGGISSVTAQAPLTVANGTTAPEISIPQASGTQDGYLSSTDWQTFNSKQPAGNYITDLMGDVVASGPGAATATIQSGAVTTGKIANEAVTFEKIQNVTSGRILGRSSGTNGSIEEIQIGANLTLSGGVLSATGGGGGVTSVSSANAYIEVNNATTNPELTLKVGSTANTVAAGDDARIVGAVQRSGDTMTGSLELPSNGLKVGTDQLVASGGKVGVGTATPIVLLDITGTLKIADGGES